ncbi:MAG TPA: Sec-independent protein translocase protein TatB [Methyloceanibacter sp.]|nr:Sec-independent protein translocase protein TatB [Methyloceanibacter sp.]
MFDIGWSELLVIAVVAIVVVGPKDLPRLMRTFGHYAGKLRRAAADFQRQFEEAMRESEVEEVRKAIESVRDETPSLDLKASIDKPVMLPKPQTAPTSAQSPASPAAAPASAVEAKPKPAPRQKRAAAKAAPKTATKSTTKSATKTAGAKGGKKDAEPGP